MSWDPTRIEEQLPTVVAALRVREPQRALDELDRLSALGTLPDGALHYRALALADIGRVQEAQETWQRELQAHPGNGRGHALYARLLIEGGKLDQAARELEAARRHAPDFPLVLLLTGRLGLLTNDDERGQRAFRDYLLLDPYGVYASEAYHALAQIAARRGTAGGAEARRLEDLSKRLQLVHGYLSRYEDRLRADPDDIDAAYGVATAYLSLYMDFGGDRRLLADAEPALQHVIDRDPSHADALNNLGFVRLEQQRYPEARELLQTAVEADPRYASSRINLGTLLLKLGERQAGMDQLRIALDLARTPEDEGRAHLQLGHACEDGGRPEDLLEAIEHYRAVLALDTQDPMHLAALIDALEKRVAAAQGGADAGEQHEEPDR